MMKMNRSQRRRKKKIEQNSTKKLNNFYLKGPSGEKCLTVQDAIELGIDYHSCGDLPSAEFIYKKILELDPNQPAALHLLGLVAHEVGDNLTAVDLFNKTLFIRPDYAEAHKDLGLALQDLGKKERALACYNKAIELKPKFAEAYGLAVRIKKQVSYNETIRNMEYFFAKPDTDGKDKLFLAFGLGKAFEDLLDFDKAFDYIKEGNKIKARQSQYSIDEQRNFVTMLKDVFDHSLFARNEPIGACDTTPIFILGMPRSGTSLIEQILASHPMVFGAGEVTLLGHAILSRLNNQSYQEFEKFVRKLDQEIFIEMQAEYLESMKRLSGSVEFTTDKMPENYRYIGIIKLVFPNAKIIHCIRNPLDNCLSIYKTLFTNGHNYSYDPETLCEYYKLYCKLMTHWHSVLPGFVYDIHYENVVSDQEGQTRKLLEFCGLEWNDLCLEFFKTRRQVRTASSEQVRLPIYNDSVKLWERYGENMITFIKALRP